MIIRAMKLGMLASVFATALAANASAGVTVYDSLSDWQTAAQNSIETPTTAESIFSTTNIVSGLKGGSELTNLNPEAIVYIIGEGWATWQGGLTPTVYWSNGSKSLEAGFSPGSVSHHPVDAFGFYVQGDNLTTDSITLRLDDGLTVNQQVYGGAGAKFFGWVGPGITSITVPDLSISFAIGDFWEGYNTSASVPEPLTLTLIGAGLVGTAVMRRRKKTKA